MLHESHLGIVRIKSLARSFVWWPKMNSRLKEKVKSCVTANITTRSHPVRRCTLGNGQAALGLEYM